MRTLKPALRAAVSRGAAIVVFERAQKTGEPMTLALAREVPTTWATRTASRIRWSPRPRSGSAKLPRPDSEHSPKPHRAIGEPSAPDISAKIQQKHLFSGATTVAADMMSLWAQPM